MRRPIVAGNWKMNGAPIAARKLAVALRGSVGSVGDPDVVLCPPRPSH